MFIRNGMHFNYVIRAIAMTNPSKTNASVSNRGILLNIMRKKSIGILNEKKTITSFVWKHYPHVETYCIVLHSCGCFIVCFYQIFSIHLVSNRNATCPFILFMTFVIASFPPLFTSHPGCLFSVVGQLSKQFFFVISIFNSMSPFP